jgi:hypothetical protein
MFTSFPQTLKEFGLQADVRTVGELYECMSRGLVSTLGDIYDVGKILIVKGKRDMAPYNLAFFEYFLGIESEHARTLEEAVRNSVAYATWLEQYLEQVGKTQVDFDESELVDRFLDDVLQSTSAAELARRLAGEDIFADDDPNMEDTEGGNGESGDSPFSDAWADYRNIDIQEILKRMQAVASKQKRPHSGGSHWIGTDGVSPYGHGGRAAGGIRIGGMGKGKSARKVLGDPEYYPVKLDKVLTDDTIDVTLAALKNIIESSVDFELDIEKTIDEGVKKGAIFVPYLRPVYDNKLQVALFIDNGGYSMRPHAQAVSTLFLKMKRRFTHDLKIYFFHNAIYDRVYTDEQRRQPVPIRKILKLDPTHKVFFVGDADMAPHELMARYGSIEPREECETPGIEFLQQITAHFPKTAWLNPMRQRSWLLSTAEYVMRVMPMYPLTPHGIGEAVEFMTRKTNQLV